MINISSIVLVICMTLCLSSGSPITFNITNNGYSNITIEIDERVPGESCFQVLQNIRTAFKDASRDLDRLLNGRVYLKDLQIRIPDKWPDECSQNLTVLPYTGQTTDVTVGLTHVIFKDLPWTKQFRPCSEPGEMIYLSYKGLENKTNLGPLIAQQWVKFRYGVFDETGFPDDKVYPLCYELYGTTKIVTGCSDKEIDTRMICEEKSYNFSEAAHANAITSAMFAPTARHVTEYCTEDSHDRYAPTKHNTICNRKSVNEIITKHNDFIRSDPLSLSNAEPTFTYLKSSKSSVTRYVLILEISLLESPGNVGIFLRAALSNWIQETLPDNTEFGAIWISKEKVEVGVNITALGDTRKRRRLVSTLPYHSVKSFENTSELKAALDVSFNMLEAAGKINGDATSVVLIIAPGMSSFFTASQIKDKAKSLNVKVVTLNYKAVEYEYTLDELSEQMDGVSYTILPKKLEDNQQKAHISTYLNLIMVFREITEKYKRGKDPGSIQILYREINESLGKNISGSFVVDESFQGKIRIVVYDIKDNGPLVTVLQMRSPSGIIYSDKNIYLDLRYMYVESGGKENGTWSYSIERAEVPRDQPHLLEVLATPESNHAPVIKARAWTSSKRMPIILYVEVLKGDFPVLEAGVKATVFINAPDGIYHNKSDFYLYDNGGGDPDITKDDGIYSRYYMPQMGRRLIYTFKIEVTNYNGRASIGNIKRDEYRKLPCCGSNMTPNSIEAVEAFQRVLTPITVLVSATDVLQNTTYGKIGDLAVKINEMKAVLSWTTPDMGGIRVKFYELRYATNVREIVDNFEFCEEWPENPLPLHPGTGVSFTIDFTNSDLVDTVLFFVLGATSYSNNNISSMKTRSNWVKIYIPRPPPAALWPSPSPEPVENFTDYGSVITTDVTNPNITEQFSIEIIIVVSVLVILLIVLCSVCFLFLRRRKNSSENEVNNSNENDKDGKQASCSKNEGMPLQRKQASCSNAEGMPLQPSLTSTKYGDQRVCSDSFNLHHNIDNALSNGDKNIHFVSRFPTTATQYPEKSPKPDNLQHFGRGSNGIPYSNGKLNSVLNIGEKRLSPHESWTITELHNGYVKEKNGKNEGNRSFTPSNHNYDIQATYRPAGLGYCLYNPPFGNDDPHSPPVPPLPGQKNEYTRRPYGLTPNAYMNSKNTTDLPNPRGNGVYESQTNGHFMPNSELLGKNIPTPIDNFPFTILPTDLPNLQGNGVYESQTNGHFMPNSELLGKNIPTPIDNLPFTILPSLQGSMSSVSSTDKKRRAVTMV